MSRVNTQEAFIQKSNQIHNGKYDYSLVQYVKSSEKVKIICSKHGVFEQTPNKHLAGHGCPICAINQKKVGNGEFISRAVSIHGSLYDYTKVEYVRSNSPVVIICPKHGMFKQTPHEHVTLQHGCPKCGHYNAGQKRRGDKSVAHRPEVKAAKAKTCLDRYGATTWSGSDIGRQRLHDIIVNEGKLEKMKETCQLRYGADNWSQSDQGKAKLHEIMSSPEVRSKIVAGYKKAYGMHYMQTDAGRKRAQSYIDDARREKMLQSLTMHYGVPYVVFSPEQRVEVNAKVSATKRRNGTFNTSKPEVTLHKLLCDVFGDDNVIQQYVDDERYPFHCDFYVISEDLFIELNAHWSHGGHWFDENNENDLEQLNKWVERTKQRGSAFYKKAINVWTVRDPLKRQFALDNNLNYVVFWKNDLSDAREYLLNSGRP